MICLRSTGSGSRWKIRCWTTSQSHCGPEFAEACLFSERGEYHCSVRNCVLEVFDGSKLIAYRHALDPPAIFPRRHPLDERG